ncbi:Rab11 family-interacting protein 1 [Apodemus speciosus]|uniref:Rab11 family-interacting protein 1 n=1 Tax=Apodemus speciosus TaxID=105296 RepID=A0ABQ0F1A2_APOSI
MLWTNGWYTLKSKPGKKDKERGEIEVDIQFMRNNMTASMFDLSVKDKSRNPFGKLKDKIKGKNKDSASDTASAIVPSTTPSVDSDDESFSKDKKKKSKIKTLFSKPSLQKTPLSQSMSVLPTSKPDKVLLRAGDLQSRWDDDDNEDESSSASDVMSHKRTSSTDHTPPNQSNFSLPRKEGLSFLGGLRSKNDSLSRSTVCINGNHVYMEQPEAKSEIRDNSPSNSPSPQGFRKKHLFSSTENLAARSPKEPGEGGSLSSDRRLSDSSKDSTKSMSLPSYRPVASGDSRESMSPANMEAARETKDSKKQESKKSSLLSLVTGKKDAAKGSEGEPLPTVSEKEKERKGTLVEEDLVRREKDAPALASQWGGSPNPFEDVQISDPEAGLEAKSEPKPPVPAARAPQTKAVKPRLEVSPEAPILSDLRSAPISTSTPVAHWPTSEAEAEGEAGEPSLLLRAASNVTPAASTGSSASGSPCEPLPTPVRKGTEESSGDKATETGPGKEASSDESGKTLTGLQEELVEIPLPEQTWAPSPQKAQEEPSVLSLSRGRTVSPSERSPTASGSSVENVHDGGVSTAVEEAMPPLEEEEALSSFHHIAQKHEMQQHASRGEKKIKKRVSFSEQLFVEEETEGPSRPEEEEDAHPQQLTQEGPVSGRTPRAGSPESPRTEGTGQESVTTEAQPSISSESESFSEGPTSEASPERGTQLLRDEEEKDDLMAPCQSKASDHEGLLSNPLSDLPSSSDMKSPIMADRSLSLPSIPEVASDDERVDEAGEGGGGAAKLVDLEAGVAPLSASPSYLESSGEASGRVCESVPMENQCGLRPQMPSSVHEELAGPGTVEEERLKGTGKPSSPLCISQDSPVPSPSPTETFAAARSFPSSPSSDTHHTSAAESQKQATADSSSSKVESFGKKKPLLQARVTPSEIHPVPAQPSAGAGAAKHRPHPVKPMNTTATKIASPSLGTATIISENMINEALMKKYQPSDPAFAYVQLTHDELIQLVLKQKETISKKEFQVRELEDYIDNLLVRVMEETPNILRVPAQTGKRAGKL